MSIAKSSSFILGLSFHTYGKFVGRYMVSSVEFSPSFPIRISHFDLCSQVPSCLGSRCFACICLARFDWFCSTGQEALRSSGISKFREVCVFISEKSLSFCGFYISSKFPIYYSSWQGLFCCFLLLLYSLRAVHSLLVMLGIIM